MSKRPLAGPHTSHDSRETRARCWVSRRIGSTAGWVRGCPHPHAASPPAVGALPSPHADPHPPHQTLDPWTPAPLNKAQRCSLLTDCHSKTAKTPHAVLGRFTRAAPFGFHPRRPLLTCLCAYPWPIHEHPSSGCPVYRTPACVHLCPSSNSQDLIRNRVGSTRSVRRARIRIEARWSKG